MSKIMIKRKTAAGDSFRKYKIYIDNQLVGAVRENETQIFDIPAGEHQIYTRIDFFKSPVHKFEINDNEEKTFEAGNNSSLTKLIINLLLTIILSFFIMVFYGFKYIHGFLPSMLTSLLIMLVLNYVLKIIIYTPKGYLKIDKT